MPTISQIVQKRQLRRAANRRRSLGKFGLVASLVISLAAALGFIFLGFAYTSLFEGLPSLEALPTLLEPSDGLLRQPTRLYDRQRQHVLLTLQNPAAANSRWVASQESTRPDNGISLPTELISATLATADPNFYRHPGFLLNGLFEDQPYTLAQRLVSDLLLWQEPPGLRRAVRERFLAAQITQRYGRQQVLEWYLNSAYYGSQAYGADAAARVYFGKSAADLSLPEAALLAAVAEAPALNPLDAPKAVVEKQQAVLRQMFEGGWIKTETLVAARDAPLTFAAPAPQPANPAPIFTDLVLTQLSQVVPLERLERGGFEIVTTLDWDLHLQTDCALQNHLARLQNPQADLPAANGSPCQAARLLPTLPNPLLNEPLQAGAAVLDPATGQVLALAGSAGGGSQAVFQPHAGGTLLTPFIYLNALVHGFSPSSLVWDIPTSESITTAVTTPVTTAITTSVTTPGAPLLTPETRYQGPMRLRMALANDALNPAIQFLQQLGSENVWRVAGQMGLETAANSPAAAGFESQPVTLLEAAHAFAVFANNGTLAGQPGDTDGGNGSMLPTKTTGQEDDPIRPSTVLLVEDAAHQVWLDWTIPQNRPVITPPLAYLMNHMLSDEVARWPSLGHPNALEIGRPAAAKLGQAASDSGAWAVGYLPQRAVSIWVGPAGVQTAANQPADPATAGLAAGSPANLKKVLGNGSAALWHAVIQYSAQALPAQSWSVPEGITTLNVCDPSGLLPTAACPAVVNEVFLTGFEPTQPDNLFQTYQINRETGRLATVFTPEDLVEERVFLIAPVEARQWASASGLETPPDAYDVVSIPPSSTDVSMTSPAMFASVKGKVEILGTASGDDFDFYRLQVGKGLNPQEWLQIGTDISQPVTDGTLATWDTQGLSGLYALQLLVIRKDQKVERSILQVTVDNEAPDARILYPADGEQVDLSGPLLTLQIEPQDNLQVQKVELWIDDKLVGTLTAAPYAFPWKAQPGDYALVVKVTDAAGNVGKVESTFRVK